MASSASRARRSKEPCAPFSSPLMYACMLPDVTPEMLEHTVIRQMRDVETWIDRTDPHAGVQPLMAIAFRTHENEEASIRLAKVLIKYGAKINTKDTSGPGVTPLHSAAQEGRAKLLQFFIDEGGDIDVHPNGMPTRPINIAAQRGHHDVVAVLAKASIQKGRTDLFETTNLKGRTPAYIVVERNYPVCLGILAKAGADLRRACPLYAVENENQFDPDPRISPGHHAIATLVRTFVQEECTGCGKHAQDLNGAARLKKCGRCQMAWYCSVECQKTDYKRFHKRCCSKVRQGLDMIGAEGAAPPDPCPEPFGFEEKFGPKDMEAAEDYNRDSHPIWEYDAGVAALRDGKSTSRWKRYPPYQEEHLESLMNMGSPRFMYKPGDPECSGFEEREISLNPPSSISTRHVYFSDMVERDVYTGAARSVRRNGSRKKPRPSDPLW